MQQISLNINLDERKQEYKKKMGGKKVEHSYQELGIEMQKYFEKNIWFLFAKYKESDIKEAFAICQRKEVKSIPYLIGCINKRYTGF